MVDLKEIIKNKNKRAKVIAKIEKPEAINEIDNIIDVSDGIMAVSYTHLRAHETVLDLVCRLLLEKKKHNKKKKNIKKKKKTLKTT